jgi:hypothetical protein
MRHLTGVLLNALAVLILLLVTVSVHAQKAAKELAVDCAVDTTGMYDGKLRD